MRISDWSSDVCSSDLVQLAERLTGTDRRFRGNDAGEEHDATQADRRDDVDGFRSGLGLAAEIRTARRGGPWGIAVRHEPQLRPPPAVRRTPGYTSLAACDPRSTAAMRTRQIF